MKISNILEIFKVLQNRCTSNFVAGIFILSIHTSRHVH